MARTCFKSGGFYKPDQNSHVSNVENDLDIRMSRQSIEIEEKKEAELKYRSDLDGVEKDLKNMLG